MYEFGVMAYDVAIIRCIVAALERYMSHPWLIEKIQILPQFGIKKIGLEFGSLQYYSYLCSCKSISYEQ